MRSSLLAILLLGIPATTASGDETTRDPRRCTVRPQPSQPVDSVAKQCAEEFIARNGYTDSPPTSDEALLVTESIEVYDHWPDVLGRRRNTLKPEARSASCTNQGCGVTFEYRDSSITCEYRIVTMTRELTAVRMEHQGLRPAPGTADAERCARSQRDR